MIFPTHVNGIPCRCKVVSCPVDGEEFIIQLQDRKGYRATWLEKHLTTADMGRLFEEYRLEAQDEYWSARCF
jgi:hypothetical protein